MKHSKRIAIAYIVGRKISKNESNAVFDYQSGNYYNFSGDVGDDISIFDYDRSNYLTGTLSSLFDYDTGNYITIDINNDDFIGFDYEVGNHFSGTVNNNSISLFDYESGNYYNFSI